MNSEFLTIDTQQRWKKKAKAIVVRRVSTDVADFGEDGFTGTFAEVANKKIRFLDSVVESMDEAISLLQQEAGDGIALVLLKRQKLTKRQTNKINAINKQYGGCLKTASQRVFKEEESFHLRKSNLLLKIKQAQKKKRTCNSCNSLIPTDYMDSLSCPVCHSPTAFLLDTNIKCLSKHEELVKQAKSIYREHILKRDSMIAAVKEGIVQTEVVWIAGAHCKF